MTEWILVIAISIAAAPAPPIEIVHIERFQNEESCKAFGEARVKRTLDAGPFKLTWRCGEFARPPEIET